MSQFAAHELEELESDKAETEASEAVSTKLELGIKNFEKVQILEKVLTA